MSSAAIRFLKGVAPTPTGSKTTGIPSAFALRPATIIASTFVTFSVPIFSTSDCAMETIDSASSTASAMTGDAPIARQAFAQSLTVT